MKYRCGDIVYERMCFASFPDQVFVLRLAANQLGKQAFKLSMSSPHDHVNIRAERDDLLTLSGQMFPHAPPEGSWISSWDGPGLSFAGQVRVMQRGGTRRCDPDSIMIDGADEVVLLVDLGTSFVNYGDISGDPMVGIQQHLGAASLRSYVDLESRHTTDHGSLFDRVAFELEDEPQSIGPSEDAGNSGLQVKPSLMALFYQVGRYIVITSSRPGSQPANLQGIWNESLWPWWGSKWTTNINLQMNYWPVETGNLSECFDPYYALLDGLRETGAKVARVHYGCDGFVFHHNADLWRAAAPVDGSWGLWPVGGAWMAL